VASVPVDDEPGQVERGVVAGLPAGVRRQRADQRHAMVVGRGQDLPDADVTRVDQVGVGQQVAGREVALRGRARCLGRRWMHRWWPHA
jgi:hypothetical protein